MSGSSKLRGLYPSLSWLLTAGLWLSPLAGCGSSPPKVEAARAEHDAVVPTAQQRGATTTASDANPPADGPTPNKDESVAMPTACVDPSKTPCVMPPAAVKRLCSKANPDIAVALFSKDSPWTRVFVAVQKADSFNGVGGPSSEQKLTFDEELVVLSERKADMGGMSVSGAGANYDMMRWDGTCATLSVAEVTTRKPPRAKHAVVPFRILADSVQRALREDPRVSGLIDERRKHCKGATMGEVTAACEKADRALNDRVVEAVRGGLRVPVPSQLP